MVLLVDTVDAATSPPLVVHGLLDETGHLATTGLALLVGARLGLRLTEQRCAVVLAASVLIDLDHVPLYAGLAVAGAGGRPFTHGFWLVAALLVAAAGSAHLRPWLVPIAAGLLLHQLRDSATGPGLPWLWPAGDALVVPYAVYAGLLVLAAAVGYSGGSSPPRRR